MSQGLSLPHVNLFSSIGPSRSPRITSKLLTIASLYQRSAEFFVKKKSPKYFYLKKLNIKEWSLRPGDNLIPQYNWKIDTALWYWICFMDDNRYLPRIDHYILDSFQGLLQVSEVSRKCRKMSIIFLIADVFIRELLLHHIIQYQWLKSPLRQNLLSQRNRKPAIQLRH